ncbi:hypothetical protein LTR53_014272 [Teratosphaeriaceae sp. CCFEE 6253]|nr:hypothetical protein LTR53_014272 [Teratosphaeriaceae sp. CCFEE 6253]
MMLPLDMLVIHQKHADIPNHHVIGQEGDSNWTSWLTPRNVAPSDSSSETNGQASSAFGLPGQTQRDRTLSRKRSTEPQKTTTFRNPWSSWHKPTNLQLWRALEWGEDTDPCIALARSHLARSSAECHDPETLPKSTGEQAGQLLRLTKPDFTFNAADGRAKSTWLGHAGVLVQFPPLTEGGRTVRCLFDPIFSLRCSPSQFIGPLRTYLAPCAAEDLPAIDVVMISHNHFDHLDLGTILSLWKHNASSIRFLVPLGNRKWFTESGIDPDRVTDLDWWDAVQLSTLGSSGKDTNSHNSGRSGPGDANATLWSSWYLEHKTAESEPYRVFFAGDSGYQFHDSSAWPPPRPTSEVQRNQVASRVDDDSAEAKYPVCPAFADIAARLGSPNLLMLPVAVGATYDYLRSMAPVPTSMNPIPRHSQGVTAHNHMPSWDAVRVLRTMTKGAGDDSDPPIAIAMHWGTFMTDPVDVLKTLGQLEWACEAHVVRFARDLDSDSAGGHERACFLALNHGQSIVT